MKISKIIIQSSMPCNSSNIVINDFQILNDYYARQNNGRGGFIHHFKFDLNLPDSVQSEIDCLIKTNNNQVSCNVILSDGSRSLQGTLDLKDTHYRITIW